MKATNWLCLGGTEIGNANRTFAYLRECLGPPVAFFDDCDCSALAPDVLGFDNLEYVSPAADPAPWVDPAELASEEFLGFLPQQVVLSPVALRRMMRRLDVGGVIGPELLDARTIEVSGFLFAASDVGMKWGERWLTEALRGRICAPDCAPDDLELLMACDDAYFRRLYGAALVSGPHLAQVGRESEWEIQEVQFQLQTQMPYLYRDAIVEVAEIAVLAATTDCNLVDVAEWFDGSTLRIALEATAGNVTNVKLSMTVSLDGTCPEERVAACTVWDIPELSAGGSLIIDGRDRSVMFSNPTTHRNETGFHLLDWSGAFPWPDLAPCAQMCVCLENDGAEEVTWSVEQYAREI